MKKKSTKDIYTKLKLLIAATAMLSLASCSTHYHRDQPHTNLNFSSGAEKNLAFTSFNFLSTAWFATDSATLKSEGRNALDSFAKNLLQMKGLDKISNISNIQVIGHTDSRASQSYNQILSERRATSVKRYLATKGIRNDKISTKGMGETQPVADNSTRTGRQQNRRVEINIAGPAIGITDN